MEGQQTVIEESTSTDVLQTEEHLPSLLNVENNEPTTTPDDPQSSSLKNKTKQNKETKTPRTKHSCPYSSCTSSVVHLPRHMRRSHGWSPRKARSVLNSFNLRKTRKEQSKRREYKSIVCPVKDCKSVVKRIHNHLTNFHKIERGSIKYKHYLFYAVPNETEVLSSSELSVHGNETDSSSECFEPQPSKMKKQSHVKQLDNVFNTIYSSGEDELETDSPPVFSESSEEEKSTVNKHDEPNTNNDPIANDDQENSDIANTNLQELLSEFEQWLKGPDGGQKDDRCAEQCRRQIELVVSFIDSKTHNLTNILHKRILRDNWLTKFDKEKRPGTVKSYLDALNQFYVFLKCEGFDVGVSTETLTTLSEQVKLWAKSYRKKGIDRFWEKRMEDMSTMRTPEQVREFDTSKTARLAISLLGEYQDTEGEMPPSQPEYTTVRDYLLTTLCINNGSRSGTLANITLQEFENAHKEDGCFVAKVKNHKTFTTHGPVNLVFTPSLHRYIHIYIAKFRNRLGNVDTDANAPLFLSWNRSKMKSSQVGTQIGSCWGKVFGKKTSSGGATAFRKAAVSAVHESNEDLRGDLANLMVHKQSTADRYYLLKSKGKSAVKTSQELSKIMRTTTSCTVTHDTEKNTGSKSNDNEESSSKELLSGQLSGRHKWTSDEISVLNTAFSLQLKQKSISMEEVRAIIKNQPLLHHIHPRKIRDKIRSYFDKEDSEPESEKSPSLPTENESCEERLQRFGLKLPTKEIDAPGIVRFTNK
jgi:hypothetical protein